MCKLVKYSDVRNEIQQHLKKKMLIPVLGSGFSRNCVSRSGQVPSGDDYKMHMIDVIIKERGNDNSNRKSLEQKQFTAISTIYHKVVSIDEQKTYLRNNFTLVELPEDKKEFLNIDWPYIYTLNIDDAIENNSRFTNVIYSNREIWDDIFDQVKCTIKLHGHVEDMLSYKDSKCEIFDQVQYVKSLNSNKILLDKLKHDYEYMNLLYIGCSLTNETDILSVATTSAFNGNHYYCTACNLDEDDLILLEDYGITHCVLFDSYEEIYEEIVASSEEIKKIGTNDLDIYKTYAFSTLKEGFETNKSYLFHGKNPVDKQRKVQLPNFFISRKLTKDIITNTQTKGTQIIVGPGCSGKTYVTLDIARKTVDKDVFVFQSRERLNDEAFNLLLRKSNCLVIADSKALSVEQIEEVIKTDSGRIKHKNSFVIIENKSNRDLSSLLSLLKINEFIKSDEQVTRELKNKFTSKENDDLNIKLVESSFGIFTKDKSIADNIIDISSRLIEKNQFEKIKPRVDTVKQVACLVALATMEKIYSEDVVILNLEEEFIAQRKKAFPLIEDEGTWDFEKTVSKNSPMKYVVNAEYWLYNQLDMVAKTKQGRKRVVDAYRYIVLKLIEHYGKPDLKRGNKNSPYKEYILFDNIIQIFTSQGTLLIREIYESLNDLLSTDPNYLHQRAKCYIRTAIKSSDLKSKREWLIKAQRDAVSSNRIFEERYKECLNEKVQISVAHTSYTVALTLCHLAKLINYTDVVTNEKAIDTLGLALASPYNSMSFIKKDKAYNYKNVVEETISTLATNMSLIQSEKAKETIEELIKIQILED